MEKSLLLGPDSYVLKSPNRLRILISFQFLGSGLDVLGKEIIEAKLALLPELDEGDDGEALVNRTQFEQHVRIHRYALYQTRHSVGRSLDTPVEPRYQHSLFD